MRGICMGVTANTKGLITTDEHGDIQYCYRTGDARSTTRSPCTITTTTTDANGDTISTTSPTSDYACSLPGPRHGHSATSLRVLGKTLVYAIFGGEASDIKPLNAASTSMISNDVHTLYFTPKTVTWIKLWTSCDDARVGVEPVCPEKRRNAALAVMGNEGAENGRLLIFGGMGGKSEVATSELAYKHGFWSYLEMSGSSNVRVFDDLWYLDLADLDEGCVSQGACTKTLVWHRVDVTGSRPGAGFGAGALMDTSSGNFYIIGGVDDTFRERDELFVFQLQDPFYKHCSATGSALTASQAGMK